jgi:uncharacterized protein (DUF1697 family)
MKTFVALLRGINVGGNAMVRMEDLRTLFTGLGHSEVATYIQSGNVIFKSRLGGEDALTGEIEAEIKRKLRISITVVIRSAEDLARIGSKNPFLPEADSGTLYVIFLKARPSAEAVKRLAGSAFAPDEFKIVGREIYARYPNGYGRSKMTAALFEGRLGVAATARNWKTVTKLLQLAQRSGTKK